MCLFLPFPTLLFSLLIPLLPIFSPPPLSGSPFQLLNFLYCAAAHAYPDALWGTLQPVVFAEDKKTSTQFSLLQTDPEKRPKKVRLHLKGKLPSVGALDPFGGFFELASGCGHGGGYETSESRNRLSRPAQQMARSSEPVLLATPHSGHCGPPRKRKTPIGPRKNTQYY